MTDPRVWLDNGDGWTVLPGVTRIAIDEQHQPIEGWPDVDDWIEGNGTGEMRGLLAMFAEPDDPTPIERALTILAPHLADETLYDAR